MMDDIRIQTCAPTDEIAKPLLEALSKALYDITGNDGRHSFNERDVLVSGSIFLIALMGEEAVGCGGFRPISGDVCEIKRMYAKYTGRGIGHVILRELERYAVHYGYKEIWLETRKINQRAVDFYSEHAYLITENYGGYGGSIEAVCFKKAI
ncbi:MAG: GNAT family N-acetyltransferase [Anaerolineaceae bacterium]|nr:GNAT family N-acetyltransferase [Anaerolineaceae bacterium]